MKHVPRIVVAIVLAAAIWLMLEQRFGSDGPRTSGRETGVEIVAPDNVAPR